MPKYEEVSTGPYECRCVGPHHKLIQIFSPDSDLPIAVIPEYSDGPQVENSALLAASWELRRELAHLVRLLEPMEREGGMNVPGLATLNGARAALAKAEENGAPNGQLE